MFKSQVFDDYESNLYIFPGQRVWQQQPLCSTFSGMCLNLKFKILPLSSLNEYMQNTIVHAAVHACFALVALCTVHIVQMRCNFFFSFPNLKLFVDDNTIQLQM